MIYSVPFLDAQIGRHLRSGSSRNALRLYYSLIHKNTYSLKKLFIEHARVGRFYIPVFGRDKSRLYKIVHCSLLIVHRKKPFPVYHVTFPDLMHQSPVIGQISVKPCNR